MKPEPKTQKDLIKIIRQWQRAYLWLEMARNYSEQAATINLGKRPKTPTLL